MTKMKRDKPFRADAYLASTSGTKCPTVGATVKDLIRNYSHIDLFNHLFQHAIQLFPVTFAGIAVKAVRVHRFIRRLDSV